MGDFIRTGRSLALFAVVGLALAGCQPAEQSADGGEMASDQDTAAVSSQDVIEMERAVWESLAQDSMEVFGQHLASDAILVGGQGVVGKQGVVSMLEGATMESYELSDFQVMQPGADVAIVVYRFSETFRPADAESSMSVSGWASTVWENRNGNWRVVMHQSTPPEEMDGGDMGKAKSQ